jgi:hypothetical protein
MGHISQAWTNLALPSADCVRDCAMEFTAAVVIAATDFPLLLGISRFWRQVQFIAAVMQAEAYS